MGNYVLVNLFVAIICWGWDEAAAHEEPSSAAGEEELEVVCEQDDGDRRLQELQAELEKVRQREAMLQSETERAALMRTAAACE